MSQRNFENRSGILAGGNWIVDQVKVIDVYPQPEQLANILSQKEGTGGAPYNVLINLAKMGARFPLMAAGLIGNDALGERILQDCRRFGIDTRYLKRTDLAPTSYTDVMTELKGGRRTFFHMRGANALWKADDIDFNEVSVKIFHLGYLLLLDQLDNKDHRYGTRAAAILAAAQKAGIKTSVDVVSENSDRFKDVVTPALRHVDYCILNEIEAGKTTGLELRDPEGKLIPAQVRRAAAELLGLGVRELVIIHFPEGAFALTQSKAEFWQPSLQIPPKDIKGTAGAGDAFCAGVLYGLHEGWELRRTLELGVCAGAACLREETCTDGMMPLEKVLALRRRYRFRELPVE